MTLAECIALKDNSAECQQKALQVVCKLAEKDPDGPHAVAALNGFARELELLAKIELDLIANGKSQTPYHPQA